jgi:outer membrane receptor protein involved in Fe transport
LFNIVGRKITSAGELPLPDVYEQARGVLDMSIRAPLRGGISLKLDAKNLLDQDYELLQGTVVREKYRTGRSFTFGMSWTR